MVYDLKPAKAPRLSGWPLRIFTALIETGAFSRLLRPSLFRDMGISGFRTLLPKSAPVLKPIEPPAPADLQRTPIDSDRIEAVLQSTPQAPPGFTFRTVFDFASAYRCGSVTPTEVADRVLQGIDASENSEPPLGALVEWRAEDLLQQAERSSVRFNKGTPLSVFDGVPVSVKDQFDQVPFHTRVGTKFLGTKPAERDATVVARLREAGALLIGKSNMHEIGLGVTGLNPHFGTPRNPYHPEHYPGGSSSGAGVSVASGLCPVAIGADGGGSIRIPAAFCGVVGLKPTYARISEFGTTPICWSVTHGGPLGATATDVALAYAVIAGPDSNDRQTMIQPPVHLQEVDASDLTGMTVGVYEPWFRDAEASVVRECEHTLHLITDKGATLKAVEIPGLEQLRIGHLLTIAAEMVSAMEPHYRDHRRDFGLDIRINLALARHFTSSDYVKAQRVRAEVMRAFSDALEQVDVILTPTTGCTAPPINPRALGSGESDLVVLTEIMRFVLAGNFGGYPAISFPAGYNDDGLPVGLQALGRHWQEHTLLRLARVVETALERKKPQIYFDLLE